MNRLVELTNSYGCFHFSIDTKTFGNGKEIAVSCRQTISDKGFKGTERIGTYTYIDHRVICSTLDECMIEITRRAKVCYDSILNKT